MCVQWADDCPSEPADPPLCVLVCRLPCVASVQLVDGTLVRPDLPLPPHWTVGQVGGPPPPQAHADGW